MNSIDFGELADELALVHTRRLALRPLCEADGWPLWLATRNPCFNEGLLWPQPAHQDQVFERVDAIVRLARRGGLAAMSAVLKDTGQWAALFRFLPYAGQSAAPAAPTRAPVRVVEMGVWTHPAFWHGRLSLELGRACVSAAFRLSEVDVLVGAAAPSNRSSCQLMTLCGLTPRRSVLRKHETLAPVELIEHEITRAQWQQQQQQAQASAVFAQVLREPMVWRQAPTAEAQPLLPAAQPTAAPPLRAAQLEPLREAA